MYTKKEPLCGNALNDPQQNRTDEPIAIPWLCHSLNDGGLLVSERIPEYWIWLVSDILNSWRGGHECRSQPTDLILCEVEKLRTSCQVPSFNIPHQDKRKG